MLKIPQKIEHVIENLQNKGYEAYIVGGCVRDMLLGKEPHDFDVTTNATPEETMSCFEKTVPTGIKHGTITVIIEGTPIEVTTFRTESEYKDHRRPDSVEFVSNLKEDLARRDFTVNAFAYNHNSGIVDFFCGKSDLDNKILRAVGEPEKRFNEDALRILRLFRFASTLGFKPEEKTLNAAIKYADTLKNISGERIFSEVYKAVTGENFSVISPLLSSNGLEFLTITENPDFELIKKLRNENELAFFAFLYLSKADIKTVLKKLKISNKLKNFCIDMEKILSFPLPVTKAEIKKTLCNYNEEVFSNMLLYRKAENIINTTKTEKNFKEILSQNEPYLISHLEINGNDLKEFGINGSKVGEILKKLQEIVIENPQYNNKSKLIEKINKIIGN